MSMDTADDLEYAENLIANLAIELRMARQRLEKLVPYPLPPSIGLADASVYCRPTCGWRDEGECADGDTCACLCGHGHDGLEDPHDAAARHYAEQAALAERMAAARHYAEQAALAELPVRTGTPPR